MEWERLILGVSHQAAQGGHYVRPGELISVCADHRNSVSLPFASLLMTSQFATSK